MSGTKVQVAKRSVPIGQALQVMLGCAGYALEGSGAGYAIVKRAETPAASELNACIDAGLPANSAKVVQREPVLAASAAAGGKCDMPRADQLERLLGSLPEGLALATVDRRGDKGVVTGHAVSGVAVSTLLRDIGKSRYFAKPDLLSMKKIADSGPASEFVIEFSLKCLEPVAAL